MVAGTLISMRIFTHHVERTRPMNNMPKVVSSAAIVVGDTRLTKSRNR